MSKIDLPYVHTFKTRHGKTLRYYRRGNRRVPLPGLPGSIEFMEAYQAALTEMPAPEIGASRTKPGSFNALIVEYYKSADFTTLSSSTKATYRGWIEPFRSEHGDKLVGHLRRKHVRAIIQARASTPAAANHLLQMISRLMELAIDLEWREDNPAQNIRKIRHESDGFHAWEPSEIAQYKARWPVGTRARLALDLLLYTGQRRSDVVRMGWQHIKDGVLTIRQDKSRRGNKQGTEVYIPIKELLPTLEALPRTNLTFLITDYGRPYTREGFGNRMRKWCDAAGLSGCSAHGLRKAAATRLANAGCTPHEIMAITGHKSLSEVERYTREADKKRNAEVAILKLKKAEK